MKKIIAVLCVLLGVMMLVCSCTGDGETTTAEVTTDAPATDPTPTETEKKEPQQTEAPNTKVTYKITVVDEAGAPLAGATVQLCVGDICRLPVPTDTNGVATFELDADDYKVKITLSGYTGEAEYSFPEGSTELKVTLTKAA